MAPTALTYTYCTSADLEALLSVDGLTNRVDDDNTGTQSATEAGYITAAINWATARINFFVASKYDKADLATDWVVNQWCVVLACHWLSTHRGNPAPGSFKDAYKEAIEDMKSVRAGENQLDLGLRTAAWPAWSNMRRDIRYPLRSLRVEKGISVHGRGAKPSSYSQNTDRAADYIPPPL